MTPSTPPLHSLFPTPAWTDARRRVENYLRAHRIPSEDLSAMATEILTKAWMSRRGGISPLAASMDFAHARLDAQRSRRSGPPPAHPPVQLGHMGQHAVVPSLAPRWTIVFQRPLLKFTNGLAMTRSLIGATWAGNR